MSKNQRPAFIPVAANIGPATVKTSKCIGCGRLATHRTKVEVTVPHGKLVTVGACDQWACGLEVNFSVFDADRIAAYRANTTTPT